MSFSPGQIIMLEEGQCIGDYIRLSTGEWLMAQKSSRRHYGRWPTTAQAVSKESETERTLRINRYGLWLLAAMIVDLFIMVYQGVT